jgi:hypothetical protein
VSAFVNVYHRVTNTMEAAYYNRGCYQSAIVIKISGPKTLHLKSIKHMPFIIINLSVIVIKLQIIRVYTWPFRALRDSAVQFLVQVPR